MYKYVSQLNLSSKIEYDFELYSVFWSCSADVLEPKNQSIIFLIDLYVPFIDSIVCILDGI